MINNKTKKLNILLKKTNNKQVILLLEIMYKMKLIKFIK